MGMGGTMMATTSAERMRESMRLALPILEPPQSLITSDNVYSRKQKFLQGRAVDEEPCR
jgi:hypothetical protein